MTKLGHLRSLSLLLALASSACAGIVGIPDPDEGFIEGGLQVPATDTRRLTRTEYEAVLRDLVGDALVDGEISALTTLPSDEGSEPFESMVEPAVSYAHVDGYVAIAERFAGVAANDDAWLSERASCLPAGIDDRDCITVLIDDWGRAAFRRPVSAAERRWLLEVYDDGASITARDGLHMVILSILNAPALLYRLEIEGPAFDEDARTYALTAHELAAKLSFLAWGSAPDRPLADAADSGAAPRRRDLRGRGRAGVLEPARGASHSTLLRGVVALPSPRAIQPTRNGSWRGSTRRA